MKVILRDDVANLGRRGDMLEVSDGYARNFLVPRGLAIRATDGALAQAQGMQRSRKLRDAADRSAAEEIATALVPQVITVGARAGAEGKLFGSVTTAEVAEAVQQQAGFELDRRKMQLEEPIRELGTHRVMVKLHDDVSFPVTVEVVAE